MDLARECIQTAVTFCDSYLTALFTNAKLENESSNLPAAVESMEKANAISPLVVETKIALSDLLFQVNREEDGKAMLCKATPITNDVKTRLQISEIPNNKGYAKEANRIVHWIVSLKYSSI